MKEYHLYTNYTNIRNQDGRCIYYFVTIILHYFFYYFDFGGELLVYWFGYLLLLKCLPSSLIKVGLQSHG